MIGVEKNVFNGQGCSFESVSHSATPELLPIYKVLQGRLKLREFGDGTAELIYYERPDKAGPKTSKYTRAQISDVASTREVLELVLGTKAVVAKQREVFLAGTTRIHLDEVDGLGTFVELEVVLTEDETDSDGERIASVLMEQLDVRQEEPH
jgi:predicted adenylyl cyclase CyaB